MEAGDESDGQEALLIHLPPQEEVTLQVVQAEVVLATRGQSSRENTPSTSSSIYTDESAPLFHRGGKQPGHDCVHEPFSENTAVSRVTKYLPRNR